LALLSVPIFTTIISKTFSAPIENAKLILQLQNIPTPCVMEPKFTFFTSLIGNLRHGVNLSNFLSLFSGNFVNCFRWFPSMLVDFLLKDIIRQAIPQTNNYYSKFLFNILSGVVAGGISLLFVYPLDLIRNRLVLDAIAVNGNKYSRLPVVSAIQCLKDVITNEGLLRPFAGFWISVLGIVVYRAAYFGLYDIMRMMVVPRTFVGRFILSWVITLAAGLFTYPFDTVRRCMMVTGYSASQAIQLIYNTGGVPAFFQGAIMNIVRGILGALLLAILDHLRSRMQTQQQPLGVQGNVAA